MHFKQDLKSKFYDGLIAALVLYLILMINVLLLAPLEQLSGKPGMLIYTLCLMAISVYSLEHSLQINLPDTSRGWFGMAGGLLSWISISLSNDLGVASISSVTGLLVLILFGLTVTRLWRRHLPVGGRFYSLVIVLCWTAQLILDNQSMLVAWNPIFTIVYRLTAYLSFLAVGLILWWLFTQTDKRMQRLSAAPWLTFFGVIGLYLLR